MSEIKPVASICVSHWRGIAGMENIELQMRVDLPDGVHPVYALPNTHRIVPVELLKEMQVYLSSSRLSNQLRAIIDKVQS
jgi:hypothetical protein